MSRPLLERSGPIAGNLIFPATSLACLVGWRSVRSCRPRSSAKVVAAGGCTLLRLHRIVFHDPSRDYPDMLVELCKLLARRLRRAEDRARGSQVARSGPAR